jgi:hypothetical protein
VTLFCILLLTSHAGAIDLADFFGADAPDGGAAKRFDGDETFGFETLQRFSDLAATGAGLVDDIRLDQALAGGEPAAANAVAEPIGDVLRACGFGLAGRGLTSIGRWHVASRAPASPAASLAPQC